LAAAAFLTTVLSVVTIVAFAQSASRFHTPQPPIDWRV
jgi:hypothetical protein